MLLCYISCWTCVLRAPRTSQLQERVGACCKTTASSLYRLLEAAGRSPTGCRRGSRHPWRHLCEVRRSARCKCLVIGSMSGVMYLLECALRALDLYAWLQHAQRPACARRLHTNLRGWRKWSNCECLRQQSVMNCVQAHPLQIASRTTPGPLYKLAHAACISQSQLVSGWSAAADLLNVLLQCPAQAHLQRGQRLGGALRARHLPRPLHPVLAPLERVPCRALHDAPGHRGRNPRRVRNSLCCNCSACGCAAMLPV